MLNFKFSIKNAIRPFLGILTIFCLLPAAIYCCSGSPEVLSPSMGTCMTKVSLQHPIYNLGAMDIFIFNDDMLQKLDCYQRFDDMNDWKGSVVSRSGKKIMTAIANSPYDSGYWLQLSSRSHLKSICIQLEDEDINYPVMTGEASVSPGSQNQELARLMLKPLISEVVLNSISCDFSKRPYSGERLSDVKVYLTNVSAEVPLIGGEERGPTRIINAGRLCEEDLEGFRYPEHIVRSIDKAIGEETVYPDIRLICYRNSYETESPGTPFTRLVIEGTLDGTRYYWPIDINRDEGGCGIMMGNSYTFDVLITRKGSLDPDIPVKTKDIVITQKVSEWKEKPDYEVTY